MNYKVLKKAINLCWTFLVVCFIIKALGGNWFALEVSNTWLEEHIWWAVLFATVTNYVLFNLYYMAICEVKHFIWWVYVALLAYFFGIQILKAFLIPVNFHIILDLISNFVIPALLLTLVNWKPKKIDIKKYFRIVIAFILNCGFQAISVMVRDVAVDVTVSTILAQFILSLDVFLMLLLYWLYSLLWKEVNKMSFVFTFLIGKNKEELEDMLKEVNEKLAKTPEDEKLLEEKAAIEHALKEA